MVSDTDRKYYVYALVDPINLGKKGPNKVESIDLDKLKHLYVNKNYTKEQIMEQFNFGPGSLNRILSENKIFKTKENFRNFAKR